MWPVSTPHIVETAVALSVTDIDGVILIVEEALQPLLSVTVTVYALGERLLMFCVVALLFHWNVNGLAPITFSVILPLGSAQEVLFITGLMTGKLFTVSVTITNESHPAAEV
jgi:hypothetical protein